jgi:predicted Zn-dependent protease
LALLLAAACAPRAPAASPKASTEQVAGDVLDAVLSMFQRSYDDPALAAYVEVVGRRIAAATHRADLRLRFHVLDDADDLGSSLVGGQVYLTRAALAALDSEAELGALLAHEIAHVAAGHAGRSFAAFGDDIPHRQDEDIKTLDEQYQADQLAVGYLVAAGYDPAAYLSMLRALHADAEPSTPSLSSRLARAARRIGDHHGGELGRERFLSHLDGLLLGVDPRGWRVGGGRIVDTRDGFSLSIPPGTTAGRWRNAVGVFDAERRPKFTLSALGGVRSMIAEALLADMKKTGPVERRSLSSASATIGRSSDGTWKAIVTVRDYSHLLLCGAARDGSTACRGRIDAVLESFRITTPDPPPATRLRILIADGPGPLGELVRSRCGAGADQALSLWLQGDARERVMKTGQAFKCATVPHRP